MKRSSLAPLLTLSLVLVAMTLAACRPAPQPRPVRDTTIELSDGWRIASSATVTAAGAEVSAAGFDVSAWTPATVPTTVLAALVESGEIKDPYFGRNLESIDASRFAVPWWYRTELTVPELTAGARLVFLGVNYRADVWLNGHRVASADDLYGAYRMFDVDIAPHLAAGANVLAVKVHPPQPGEPTIGFVDWNPEPPDKNMGLWRGIELRLTGAVAVDDVVVRSDLELEAFATAALTIGATVSNRTDHAAAAVVTAVVGDVADAEIRVQLEPGERRQIELTPADFPQLVLQQPRLWWPNNLGEPELYSLEVTAAVDGEVSDRHELTFGIRHVEDYLNDEGHRGYKINGKEVLIRGGGWVDDLMLADDDRKVEDQMRYVRHLNFNTVRLEGFWGSSRKLFDLADRYGILVMVGWSCQWEWEEYLGGPVDEFGGLDTPEEQELITRSLRDQVVWLRNHPSVFLWVLASDMLPRPELEKRYLAALDEVDPTRPALAACSVRTSEVSGPTGVKMNGPYGYVPPNYWYLDRERGGAYGFNTETGPGAQPPPAESIRRMLPEESWWPIDEVWEYHCGRHNFNTLDRYLAALENRYGKAKDLDDFARKAQVVNYEAMRGMFESFSIRRPSTTGLIQWMLNSAWPEMFWQLYDHYLVPNGAYYGARNANRPLHVVYDYADRGVVAVNDTAEALAGAVVRARVFDTGSKVLVDESATLDLAAESLARALTVPAVSAPQKAYFLDLRMTAADGSELASNFYWLSTQEDVLDWDASEWFVTPISRYADLTALTRLPPVELEVEHRFEPAEGGRAVHVKLENPSGHVAFFVALEVLGASSGQLAAPILWDDNYVSLVPGERREIRGTFPAHALDGEEPVLRISGMNVE
jgi:exo-1,4-beta-D-glucosaminidase